MRDLNWVCLCESSSVYMCVNLSHTQISTVLVLSMSGLWSGLCILKEHFEKEKKKKNMTQIPGEIVSSNPDDTTVICGQEPKSVIRTTGCV